MKVNLFSNLEFFKFFYKFNIIVYIVIIEW
jgi:hypothetical protein